MSRSVLAIIPARGGSKGIPRKNLVHLNGKPLLAYTINAAKNASLVGKIVLSSEDDEINNLGLSMGLASEYRRPATLATDGSDMMDVVIHILEWLKFNDQYSPESVLLLQPTSPLRTAADIDRAIQFYQSNHLQSLTSVHRMKEHPYDCIRGVKDHWSYLAERKCLSNRRQDYQESFFYINGAIYIASLNFIMTNKCFVNETTFMYEMNSERGIDIDEYQDLNLASFLLKSLCKT
jgi:N-acylneuraminate cytidylyltransferase/CMP-N,N'-diacetyllegionaminic acid synthase